MSLRHRPLFVAAALLAGLVFALPVSAQSNTTGTVTFSSQPGTASLLTHYVVSAADRSHLNSASANAIAAGGRTSQEATGAVASKGSTKISRSISSDASPRRAAASAGGVTAGSAGIAANTPSPSQSFPGQQSSATTCSYFGQGCNPPDMALGASPQFVLQGVNTQWSVWDTAGNVQAGWPVSAQAFFGVPNVTNADGDPCDVKHLSQPFLSDPRAVYDPVDQRFWAAMLQIENGFGIAPDCPFLSVYYVAVSRTSDPNGDWNVYEFEMSQGKTFAGQQVGADYTQLGFDSQAVYFTANMFTQDGNFYAWAELFEANKSQMESGLAHFTAAGFYNLKAVGPASAKAGAFIADTVQPAMNLDGSANGAEVFVDTLDGPDPVSGNLCGQTGHHDPCSGLALWKLNNPTAHDDQSGPLPALAGTYVATQPYLINPPADQPSCSRCIDANDLRIAGTPAVRNGFIYTAWGSPVDNGAQAVPAIEWAQVSLSGTVVQQGLYTLTDTAVTYPTLMPDTQGNLVMLFERMSRTVFPETSYIVKAAGDANFNGEGVVLKAGESSYRPERCGTIIPVCRWGDYEAASFDGAGRIWFAGEYANHYDGIVPPVYGRNWGTWIGAIG